MRLPCALSTREGDVGESPKSAGSARSRASTAATASPLSTTSTPRASATAVMSGLWLRPTTAGATETAAAPRSALPQVGRPLRGEVGGFDLARLQRIALGPPIEEPSQPTAAVLQAHSFAPPARNSSSGAKPWDKPIFGEARGGMRMCLQIAPKPAAKAQEQERKMEERESLECSIDETTSVPRDLFDHLLRRGQDARAGGQHVLSRKQAGQPHRLVHRDLLPP